MNMKSGKFIKIGRLEGRGEERDWASVRAGITPAPSATSPTCAVAARRRPARTKHFLPAPKPGVVVTVPLSVLPRYLAFFHLEPIRYGWSELEGDDVLTVKPLTADSATTTAKI